MRKLFKSLPLLALALTVSVTGFVGCDEGTSENNGGGFGNFTLVPPPVGQREVVNLAVGDSDDDFEGTFNGEQVAVFCDVLNDADQNTQEPDVLIDDTTGNIDKPRHLLWDNGDLYVSNEDSNSVDIFRDVCDGGTTPAPDVTLGTLSLFDDPREILMTEDNTLIVADGGNSEIYFYVNADELTGDVAEDSILDGATSEISSPWGIFYASDTLWAGHWDSSDAEEQITRFDDVEAIVAGNVAVAPDAALFEDTSFLEFDAGVRRVYVETENDVLYATVNNSGSGDNALFIFENASTFSDNDLPWGFVIGDARNLLNPHSMAANNGYLYVAQNNRGEENDCNNNPGILGYTLGFDEFGAPNGSIETGAYPDVVLDSDVAQIQAVQEMAFSNNWFFAQNMNNCSSNYGYGNIKIFYTAGMGMTNTSAPSITLPPLVGFATPISLAIESEGFPGFNNLPTPTP